MTARDHYRSGFRHFSEGNVAAAIAAYREALEIDEGLAIAWNGLAMALAKQGDLETAIEAAQRYVDLDPEEPLAYTSLSVLYQQKGMIPEAEEAKAVSMQLQMKRGH